MPEFPQNFLEHLCNISGESSEIGLRELGVEPFLAIEVFGKNPFWRRGSKKMRQGRFPPFGFVLAEFGLRELGSASFWSLIISERISCGEEGS